MTTILADQLITYLEQPITVNREVKIASLRALMYFHNLPTGNFSFNFYDYGGFIVKSYPFTAASAAAAIGTVDGYFWLDYAIPGTLHLVEGEYTIKLESSGYAFNTGSWVGLAKDYGNSYGNTIGTAIDFSHNPYSIKLIEYQDREGLK